MEVVKELTDWEDNYLKALRTFLGCFIKPLQHSGLMKTGEESVDLLLELFSSLERIIKVTSTINDKLRIIKESKDIGKLFKDMVPVLSVYSEYYRKYSTGTTVLNTLISSNPKIKEIIEHGVNSSGKLLWPEEYLSMPIQHIPRYNLLLRDILKYTEIQTSEYDKLQEANEMLCELLSELNDRQKLETAKVRVTEVERKLIGWPKSLNDKLCTDNRVWIAEGEVRLVNIKQQNNNMKKIKKKDFYMFLFSDLVLLTEKKKNCYRYYDSATFGERSIVDVEEYGPLGGFGMKAWLFQAKTQTPGFTIFVFNTAAERNEWISHFKSAFDLWKGKRSKTLHLTIRGLAAANTKGIAI